MYPVAVEKYSSGEEERNFSDNKDWNEEFQNIMESEDEKKYNKMANLARDFVHASQIISKLIISEYYLPIKEKTIRPQDLGGIAGGSKYICHGILFKFATANDKIYKTDENAMKIAGHELRGLMCYYNARIPGICLPLMCLIDYCGYRIVALSLLPVNKHTLIYGSSDGGLNVVNSNPEFDALMHKAAKVINLKPHVSRDGIILCGPTDIEGHRSDIDGRYYLLDFARYMIILGGPNFIVG